MSRSLRILCLGVIAFSAAAAVWTLFAFPDPWYARWLMVASFTISGLQAGRVLYRERRQQAP